jgi:hypothetical protein
MSADFVSIQTLDNCIGLRLSQGPVPTEQETAIKKKYSFQDLKDLHSRLMLIGGQMERDPVKKKEIDFFSDVSRS